MKLALQVAILALGGVLAACGDDMPTDTGPSLLATALPTTIAAGGDVTVTVTADHFTLEVPGGPNASGHGHYHVYLDGATGGNYLAEDAAASVQVTIPGTTVPGPHTLRVELANNDHSALNPAVSTMIDLTVQ